jgi:hypothetical protein
MAFQVMNVFVSDSLCHGRHFVFSKGVLPIIRKAYLSPRIPDV